MKKNETKYLMDTALHPVRMRILVLLSGSEGMTPQQMGEHLSDVPQATLYRHINRLVQAGVLEVVEERPVRGTLEKVYALNRRSSQHITTSDAEALEALNRMSPEDHMRFFTAFVMGLLDDFSRYLHQDKPLDFAADGVGYHKLPLFLSDEEFAAFTAALNQAIVPYFKLEAEPGRKKRLFTTIMMPSEDGSPSQDGTNQTDDQKD